MKRIGMWMAVVVVLVAGSGCKGKRVATESAVVEVEQELMSKREMAIDVASSETVAENVVVERPVIEIQDAKSGDVVTIRGERLVGGREGVREIEEVRRECERNDAEVATEITTDHKSRSEGNAGGDIKWVVAVVAMIYLLGRLKKIMRK